MSAVQRPVGFQIGEDGPGLKARSPAEAMAGSGHMRVAPRPAFFYTGQSGMRPIAE
jgi:hypothetical protein